MAQFGPEWWLSLIRNRWLSLVRNIQKAIKLVQIALKKGEIPPINFDLINNNENGFYWFGEKIRIFATADGNDIAYEVIRQ